MILLAAPCGNVAGGVSATLDRGTVVDPDGAVAMLTGPRHPGWAARLSGLACARSRAPFR